MPAMLLSLKNIWKKAAILCAVGVALSLLREMLISPAPGMLLTDTLFAIGTVFFCFGLGALVRNLGVFNSLKYGFKSLFNMFRGKRQEPEDKMVGGYLEYIKSRPKSKDVPWIMAFAAAFFVLSLLAALPML